MKGDKVRRVKGRWNGFNSRGAVGQIISWVLLLGFAVGLGTGVFLWQARQAEGFNKGVVRFVSGVLDCENIDFNIQSSDGCTEIVIRNSGFFDVDGFVVRSFSSFGVGSEVETVFAKAQSSAVLDVGLVDAERVEVTPVVEVSGELVGCKDMAKQIDCTGLDDTQKEACDVADAQGTCDLLEGLGVVTCLECCEGLRECCAC